jgi:CRISPR/Cas system type I-B associated protein Csh2 (Cas7 group RAMP superfamily)
MTFKLSTEAIWVGSAADMSGKTFPIMRMQIDRVFWYTWAGKLVRVSHIAAGSDGYQDWYLDVDTGVPTTVLFPLPEKKNRLSEEELHLKLAALLAHNLGPKLERHMTRLMMGQ